MTVLTQRQHSKRQKPIDLQDTDFKKFYCSIIAIFAIFLLKQTKQGTLQLLSNRDAPSASSPLGPLDRLLE